MKNQTEPFTDNTAKKLRDEALADSPQFSPVLHARIMQQIHGQTRPLPALANWRIGWIASSIAAAVLFAVTIWSFNHRQIKPQVIAVNPTSIPKVAIPQLAIQFPNLSEPVNSPLSLAHYGNLDRDAKAAADYVRNQFDIIPSPPGRRG